MLEERSFKWTKEAQKSFALIKKKMTEAPILSFPNFSKIFEANCDTSDVGINMLLRQEGRPIPFPFFCEKISNSHKKYSSYEL